MEDFFIGVDIGTSSVRAVLFDHNGYKRGYDNIEYSVLLSDGGIIELDPERVFDSTLKVINGCMQKNNVKAVQICGIGLSCQMHSLMAVDIHGNPLTRLITWADTRAVKEAEFIKNNFDMQDLYNRTGCRIQHTLYPLSKILWLKHNHPDIIDHTYKFITIKEYILYRLYGEYIIDYTLAASQGYFNIHKQKWDEDILKSILGMGTEKLSYVVDCFHILKGIRSEYAGSLEIDAQTPVAIGSGDGIMANIGCGVYDSTALSSTIGTSGAIRTAVEKPLLDPLQQTWCYSFTDNMWVAGGAINNGGIVLKWLREEFRKQFELEAAENNESIYKLFDRYAAEIKAGSDGLIFLPYLTGERSPDWNANVRGLMYGLGINHGRKHIVRAAMEGIIYRLYSVYEAMARSNKNASRIIANGGYTKSDIWLQIQADIFEKDILVSGVDEASALGAAYVCMVSLGAVADIKQLLPGMKPERIIHPIPENSEIYRTAYRTAMQVYRSIYG